MVAPAPCPYCDSQQLHFVHHLLTHAVCCQHCGACGPSQRQLEDAVSLWNQVLRVSQSRTETAKVASSA